MSSSTTEVETPPKTSAETAFEKQVAEMAKLQVDALKLVEPLVTETFESIKPVFDQISARQQARGEVFDFDTRKRMARRLVRQQEQFDDLRSDMVEMQQDIIASGGQATPEQLEAIRMGTFAAGQAGRRDIVDVGADVVDLVERVTGTFDDRRGMVAREQDRQLSNLTRRLEGNEATARLEYPLAANKLRAQQIGQRLGLAQNALNFNHTLAQQDLSNRLQVTGAASEGLQGLTRLAGQNVSAASAPLEGLQSRRLASTTTTTEPGLGLLGLGIAQGVGGKIADKVGGFLGGLF